mmetsp:Transcript_59265/g.118632  ORF Transcript_59265/g.118632 Transcript_59265/m.118632 type:complete len:113 (-) Transcript_59265:26-364(-)
MQREQQQQRVQLQQQLQQQQLQQLLVHSLLPSQAAPAGCGALGAPSYAGALGLGAPWPGSAPLGQPPPHPAAAAGDFGAAGLRGADESLCNQLMAWYWSGYYTDKYAARQGR